MALRGASRIAVVALVAAAGCRARSLSLAIDFASEGARRGTSALRLVVHEGACDGPELFTETLPFDVTPSARARLSPGTYGIRAQARDPSCLRVAEVCEEVTLPLDQDRLTLTLADVTPLADCPSSACRSGVCLADTPTDGGLPCEDTCGGTCRDEVCCEGCWDGARCAPGDAVSACGIGGEDCAPCATDALCGAGRCRPPVDVSASPRALFARVGEAVYSAGDDGFDQRGELEVARTDAFVRQRSVRYVDVAAAERATCALDGDGAMWCWGTNASGALGIGAATDFVTTEPQRVGAERWVDVDAGALHLCAIRADGRLFCWGNAGGGRLGSPGLDASTPRPVALDARWRTVSAGAFHTCAITLDGRLYCWGDAESGKLGAPGVTGAVTTPTEVAMDAWRSVSAGVAHTCGVRAEGELYCWGRRGAESRLGDGVVGTDQPEPLRIAPSITWRSVAAGQLHTCAIAEDRALYCWGNAVHSGHGPMSFGTPEPVGGRLADALAVGWRASCAATHTAGALDAIACWGQLEDDGPLGTGDVREDVPTEVMLDPPP